MKSVAIFYKINQQNCPYIHYILILLITWSKKLIWNFKIDIMYLPVNCRDWTISTSNYHQKWNCSIKKEESSINIQFVIG